MTAVNETGVDVEIVRRRVLGLLLAENLGDVHDQIIMLCRDVGLPEPEGDFLDGFDLTPFDRTTPSPDIGESV